MMVVFTMTIRNVCYYEIVDTNETTNATRCLKFLKKLLKSIKLPPVLKAVPMKTNVRANWLDCCHIVILA